jgi:hypothetical protein
MTTATIPPQSRTTPSVTFDALANALARGDDVDAELVEAIVGQAGRTMADLAAAVAERVEQLQA